MNYIALIGIIAAVAIVAIIGFFAMGGFNPGSVSISNSSSGTSSVGVSPFGVVFLPPSQVSSIYGQAYSASGITNLSVNNYESTYSKSYFGPSGSEIVIAFDKFNTDGNATQDYNSFIGNAQSVNYSTYEGLRYEVVSSQPGQSVILVLNSNYVLMIEFLKGAAIQNNEINLMQQEVNVALV